MNVALIGSVSSSWYALDALLRSGVTVTCVAGVDESRAAEVCDYRSLRELTEAAGVPYFSFVKVAETGLESFLRAHQPDLLWVIGLSQLVPHRMIEMARHGAVGFHPTMLPKGRGRAPVAWTIILGERAAVNLFFLCDQADAGDIIVQREVPVLPDDYSEDLIQRTNIVLAEVIESIAPAINSGQLPRKPQDHSLATYYEKRTPADGLIDWSKSSAAIYRLIRAAGRPYPGAFCFHGHTKIVIRRAEPAPDREWSNQRKEQPGRVLQAHAKDYWLVRTGDGAIRVTECESEGRPDQRDPLLVGVCLTSGAVPGP